MDKATIVGYGCLAVVAILLFTLAVSALDEYPRHKRRDSTPESRLADLMARLYGGSPEENIPLARDIIEQYDSEPTAPETEDQK